MINLFIGAITFIVALFYLKKRENVKYSFVNTIIYFTATICVGTFFYKTNQIVELGYAIYVDAYKSSCSKDSSFCILDTIPEVEISHHFESTFFNNAFKRIRNNHTDFTIQIKPPKNIDYKICKVRNENEVNNVCNLLKVYPQQTSRMYGIELYLPFVPDIIPLKIRKTEKNESDSKERFSWIKKLEKSLYDNKGLFKPDFHKLYENDEEMAESLSKSYDEKYIPNGLQQVYSSYSEIRASSAKDINEPLFFRGELYGYLYDFFTAADISQYVMSLTVRSDCQINNIRFIYDIPVDVSSKYDDIESGTYGFGLQSSRIKDIKEGGAHHIYVKLPSMANLQLVRSFILTTLLTALLTLFLTSFISTLRLFKQKIEKKIISKYFKKENNTKVVIKEEKVLTYVLMSFVLLISIPIWYLCYRLYNDNPIILTVDDIDKLNSIILAITLPFVACLSYLYVIVWYKNNKKINKTI